MDFISKVTANKAFTQAYHEFVPPGCYVGLLLQVRNSSIVTEDPSVLQLIRSLGLRLRRGCALPSLLRHAPGIFEILRANLYISVLFRRRCLGQQCQAKSLEERKDTLPSIFIGGRDGGGRSMPLATRDLRCVVPP